MIADELRKTAGAIGFYGHLIDDNAPVLAALIEHGDRWKDRAASKADWVREFCVQLDKQTAKLKELLNQI